MQKRPQKKRVAGAPICLEQNPDIRLPNGAIPIKAMVYMLMTLPRLSSSESVCSMVLHAAMHDIMPTPVVNMKTSENANERDCENSIRPTLAQKLAMMIMRDKPRKDVRPAR